MVVDFQRKTYSPRSTIVSLHSSLILSTKYNYPLKTLKKNMCKNSVKCFYYWKNIFKVLSIMDNFCDFYIDKYSKCY